MLSFYTLCVFSKFTICVDKESQIVFNGEEGGFMTNKIKEFRLKAGVSQETLARKCGWKQSRIGNYEAQKRTPTIRDAQIIVSAISELLNGDISFSDVFPPDSK